ncbi:putative protein phosphatase 2C 46 [Acorus gramineus]|uniref:Uncharacterized protein n=1 Tax=Acorus gramineus TaxID=55184 RepID=A0AAV9BAM4_ACOGR|nr:putative protein phosphatase 2C 46 [Acorus gramineus]
MIDGCNSLQWVKGKAGEDRAHVVVLEEHGWVFIRIYDGFNDRRSPPQSCTGPEFSWVHCNPSPIIIVVVVSSLGSPAPPPTLSITSSFIVIAVVVGWNGRLGGFLFFFFNNFIIFSE